MKKPFYRHVLPIILVGVILISLIFSIMSISISMSMSSALTNLTENPYTLSQSIYRIKNSVSEGQARISRLAMHNSHEDILVTRMDISKLQSAAREELGNITARYALSEAASELSRSCEQLFALEEYLLTNAGEYSLEDIDNFIEYDLGPVCEDINRISDEMLGYLESNIEGLISRSRATLSSNLALAVVMTIGIAVLSVLLFLSYRLRERDTFKREFLFNLISSHIDDVFIIYDINTSSVEYVFANSERILGVSGKVVRENVLEIFRHCADSEQISSQFARHLITAKVETELLFTNPQTAEEKWLLLTIYPVDPEGASLYIISFQDLSEVKKSRDILNDALLNAQYANSAKSDFLSHMSHEIRTPINAIIGMTAIAASVIDNPIRVEDCLLKISNSSKHLLMLINDVLDMSKIETGKLSIVNDRFSIPDLLVNLTGTLNDQTKSKNQSLELVIPSLINEQLIGDSLRLNQVLLNILSNAVKYTPEGGSIRFEVKEIINPKSNDLTLRFTISDTGIGMSPEFLEKIFIPFEQENRVHNSGSTGIGMAIVKNLVTLMGGTINVTSIIDKGSTFTVTLPFETPPETALSAAVTEFKDLRVLVVDDDVVTCEHTSIILDRIGIHGEWCLSSQEALERINQAYDSGEGYDVTFIDWKMPEMDGLELTRRIRKKLGPEVLIIIISAYPWSAISDKALEAGANGFIPKPMCKSGIFNALVSAMHGQPTPQSNTLDIEQVDLRGKRFLVAEDNAINMEIVTEMLSQSNGQCDTAVNGKEAYNKFILSEPGYYDVILMDIQMPEWDGYKATQEIRKSQRPDAESVKIIALTANAFTEDILMSSQMGMDTHISKPIDVRAFYDTILKYTS